MIAGIDFSTHAVDVVLLHEEWDQALWVRYGLGGHGAFDRARNVSPNLPSRNSQWWDAVVAVGIEQPRGNYGTHALMRIQGAILACIPGHKLVQPWNPSEWRKAVGLPGNCPKAVVADHVAMHHHDSAEVATWPQDACDAYCIALATRQALHHG